MNIELHKAIAAAAKEKEIAAENLLRAINGLSKAAWSCPAEFYAQLGTQAAAEARLHRGIIDALKMLDPAALSRINWPPFEVIYLHDGSAVPTQIPFDPARPTLTAADATEAAGIEAAILANHEQ